MIQSSVGGRGSKLAVLGLGTVDSTMYRTGTHVYLLLHIQYCSYSTVFYGTLFYFVQYSSYGTVVFSTRRKHCIVLNSMTTIGHSRLQYSTVQYYVRAVRRIFSCTAKSEKRSLL